jgi:YVTN family beta-propeller protein
VHQDGSMTPRAGCGPSVRIPLLLMLLWPAWAGAAEGPPPAGGTAVQEGIAVELRAAPVVGDRALREGDNAAIRFKVFDQATGSPVAGRSPLAWLARLRPGESAASGCREKLEELVGGGLFNRPAVDLNVYYVLVLNDDATISVVDPLFGFGGTKLLTMVELDSPGEDWVLSPDGSRLYVSLPDAGKVAVVDTADWKVIARVETGARPRRLALQPDGTYLWVTLEAADAAPGAGGVAAIRTVDHTVAARIQTGRGTHDLAVSDDNRFAFVTNRDSGTLSVIDVARLAKLRDAALGSAPSSVAFSPLARAAYVASEEAGTITVVLPEEKKTPVRIASAPGLGAVRFAPGGRYAFVPNPRENRVIILDSSSNRIVQTARIDGGPDQITFSQDLAYIRRRDSEVVLMIPLDQIADGKAVPVVDFPGGQHPLGKGTRPSLADSIVRAPEATAVLVANPVDRAVYYYKEGMAAPMGSFSNYEREPRAVLVVDRSLKERSPGLYQTTAEVRDPGRYRVAFFLDSPRIVQCFELEVAPSPELEAARRAARPVQVQPLMETRRFAAGQAVRLRFRLTDPNTGQPVDGLKDVHVMLYRSPGNWQVRPWGQPAGPGIYEVEVVPPEPGDYKAAVECRSRKLSFNQSPVVTLQVVAGDAGPSRP